MVQATFFTQKLNPPILNNDLKKIYYIPVVETIGDMQQISAWKYARNPLVSRMFYSSTDELFAQERLEAGRTTVSCYKVMLDTNQIALLNQSKCIGNGHLLALNFLPRDILSCVKLSGNERSEVVNPFYQTNEIARAFVAAPGA